MDDSTAAFNHIKVPLGLTSLSIASPDRSRRGLAQVM